AAGPTRPARRPATRPVAGPGEGRHLAPRQPGATSGEDFPQDGPGARPITPSMPATTNLDNFGSASAAEFHPSALTGHVIGGRVVIVAQHALVAQCLALVLGSANVTTYVTTDASLDGVLRQVRASDPALVLVVVS